MMPRTEKETEGDCEVQCRETAEIGKFPHALLLLPLSAELFLLAQNKCVWGFVGLFCFQCMGFKLGS